MKMQSDFNNHAAYLDVRWDEALAVMCRHVKLMVKPTAHALSLGLHPK